MTIYLLLDTHCWLWAQLGLAKQLSRSAVTAIRRAESAAVCVFP